MPREDRRIVLDYTETYKAIFTLCMQNELARPFARSITAISFKADDGRCVVVRFANGLQGTSATKEYSRDFLAAAALMLYCRTCSIPVPKKAMKSVELGGDSVTLHVTL
jgi:hypothetical protein